MATNKNITNPLLVFKNNGSCLVIHGAEICLLKIACKHIPPMQASWSGEKVNSGGFTVAPYSSSSFTHSRLPAAQASHSGVLPSMLRASTWRIETIHHKHTSHVINIGFPVHHQPT